MSLLNVPPFINQVPVFNGLPVFYYNKMPSNKDCIVIVTDPILATAGSACDAITLLKNDGYTNIRLICLVASPKDVEAHFYMVVKV